MNENELFICKVGSQSTYCCYRNGVLYTKLSTVLRFFGYSQITLSKSMKSWVGNNIFMLLVGKTNTWFINKEGIDAILANTNQKISYNNISTVYSDVFGIDRSKDSEDIYMYKFTGLQMLEIYELINSKPIHKEKVLERLKSGKII